ncbi:TadE-like protein [Enhydrobacter aerosaccus]|uniref:TadE-like protein n=1 Tax=Enhydrobacter aerosaccus TaxID=225324 RepID=A0A1T4T914_9HYPH|nr:TadE/TadG family type IV pilus assembly protein [Enhydrobacter aerosaccus]SKA36985.1 TadE-like protein [Enhydrobacter aerosaccus]
MRGRVFRRLLGADNGVAAIEFAIVLPVLLTMLLGALEFGRMFYLRQGLEYATESAARYYSMNPTASTSTVTSYLQGKMIGGAGSNISVAYASTANCNANSTVTCTMITATYTFSFAENYLGFGSKILTATSQAVLYGSGSGS